ncbi:3'-5' exonuclease [Streptomyces parvus]
MPGHHWPLLGPGHCLDGFTAHSQSKPHRPHVRAEELTEVLPRCASLQFGRDFAGALERARIGACVPGAGRSGPGVRIGTRHRMEGVEFRCVAVAGVNDGTVPAVTPVVVDAQQRQEDVNSELSLLFVACTRARVALRVSRHGEPSPFLAPARARSAERVRPA